jgi:hypothetical protein
MLPHPLHDHVVDQATLVTEDSPADMNGTAHDDFPSPGDPPIAMSGRDLPPHLRRAPGPTRPALSDPVSQRIAFLLSLHPEIDREYQDVDLRKITSGARRHILDAINQRLNIPSRA